MRASVNWYKSKSSISSWGILICIQGGKLRRIYIPKALQEEALAWLNEIHRDSGFIFLNRFGERITTRGISGQLKNWQCNMALIPPWFIRTLSATALPKVLERCSDIAFLADLMGHESIETTRIYLRKTATEQRALVDNIVDW